MHQISIRKLNPEDVSCVYELLKNLVREEGTDKSFILTIDKMQYYIFGKYADWNCVVAVMGKNEIIGFCLYSFANTNRAFNDTPLIQIDDIYVRPEYRGLKAGQKLIQEVAHIAKNNNITRIELWCMKDNLSASKFYNKFNVEKLEFLEVLRLKVDKVLSHVKLNDYR
jgi:ribosomal protein S18 acetylase RimI-like enzyme